MTRVEDYYEATIRPTIDGLVTAISEQGFSRAETSVALSLAFSQLSVSVNRYLIIAQRNYESLGGPLRADLAELMARKADELVLEMRDAVILAEIGPQ